MRFKFTRTIAYTNYRYNPEATEISYKIGKIDSMWSAWAIMAALGGVYWAFVEAEAFGFILVSLACILALGCLFVRLYLKQQLKDALENGKEKEEELKRREKEEIFNKYYKPILDIAKQAEEWKREGLLQASEESTSSCICQENKQSPEEPIIDVDIDLLDSSIHPKVKRAFLFLEDAEWEKAESYLEEVLDEDPMNAYAYVGKLMIDYKLTKMEKLSDFTEILSENKNYQKALRYADQSLSCKLNALLKTKKG